jgi:hypothetical protein
VPVKAGIGIGQVHGAIAAVFPNAIADLQIIMAVAVFSPANLTRHLTHKSNELNWKFARSAAAAERTGTIRFVIRRKSRPTENWIPNCRRRLARIRPTLASDDRPYGQTTRLQKDQGSIASPSK